MTQIESLDPDPGFTPIIKAVTLPTTTTTTKTLSYTNSQWGDLLTSFDGTAITYDEIGNPLSYYNGSSYTFTWEGRRLVGATRGSNTMSFTYNDDGIRTSKTADGVTTTYYVNGGQIVAEKTDTRTIVYIYDATGAPIGMMYRAPSYAANTFDVFWYEKNLQGDIVAVYNSSGTKVATYTYSDAWGNFTVSYSNGGASTGAQYNPFRYRGYYYDTDLSMYYLQSRYYDAKICRFISADYASVTTVTPYALTDKNLYAYCDNNPVTRVDGDGMFWATVFDIASLAFSIAEVAYDPSNTWAWIGLFGDVIDLLPVITGVGEATDLLRLGMIGGGILDAADDAYDTARSVDRLGDFGEFAIKYTDEVKLNSQIKHSEAIDKWNDFLGPNQTNRNPYKGILEKDRIFSADGSRSIRFGNHEMNSIGTNKAHFHYETWMIDLKNKIVFVKNELQRLR